MSHHNTTILPVLQCYVKQLFHPFSDTKSRYPCHFIGRTWKTIRNWFKEKELYVSTGSACSSKLQKPEKTILAISNDEQLAKSTVRISLSHLTTNEELDVLINTINNI